MRLIDADALLEEVRKPRYLYKPEKLIEEAPTVRCEECEHRETIVWCTDGPEYAACLRQGWGDKYLPAPNGYGCAYFERRRP